MNFLYGIRTKLHNYYLNGALKKHKVSHESINFGVAKSVGILFDATELVDRETVLGYAKQLKNDGKTVKLLAYSDGDQTVGDFSFNHFTKKELNFALQPKTDDVQKFITQKFDILINLCPNQNLPFEYISALSNAQFRVGPLTEKTFCYDLMIDTSGKKDLKPFIKQITFFLKKMGNIYEESF